METDSREQDSRSVVRGSRAHHGCRNRHCGAPRLPAPAGALEPRPARAGCEVRSDGEGDSRQGVPQGGAPALLYAPDDARIHQE